MRIRRVQVHQLFNMFDHEIVLSRDERVTIIFGPNGIGKTIILSMINGLLNSDYRVFRVPFNDFMVEFDDGGSIKIEQNRDVDKQPTLTCSYHKPGCNEDSFSLSDIDTRDFRELQSRVIPYIEERIKGLDYLGQNLWSLAASETLSSVQLSERLKGQLPERVWADLLKLSTTAPDWFLELRKQFPPTRLIETKRLTRFVPADVARRYREAEKAEVPTVKLYSEELATNIAGKVREYAALSQRLDSTFPNRVITQVTPSDSAATETYNQLRQELQLLSQKGVRLQEDGLLVGQDLQIPDSIEDDNRRNFVNGVLAVYVRDLYEKFSVFDDLAKRIELLMKNINERFSFKRLSVTQGEGFVFETPSGKTLSPVELSSGEQHELVLNYELLFKIQPNSFILIDEPELSLHIAWQQQFLSDLLAITKISDFDVLVATHSPDIIHKYWNLTVDLGESVK